MATEKKISEYMIEGSTGQGHDARLRANSAWVPLYTEDGPWLKVKNFFVHVTFEITERGGNNPPFYVLKVL